MEKSFYEWAALYHSKMMPELYGNGAIGDIIKGEGVSHEGQTAIHFCLQAQVRPGL